VQRKQSDGLRQWHRDAQGQVRGEIQQDAAEGESEELRSMRGRDK
jgi:hypothetical protein